MRSLLIVGALFLSSFVSTSEDEISIVYNAVQNTFEATVNIECEGYELAWYKSIDNGAIWEPMEETELSIAHPGSEYNMIRLEYGGCGYLLTEDHSITE